MLRPAYLLLHLLLLLGGPRTSDSHKVYRAAPAFGCPSTALSEVKASQEEDAPLLNKRSFPGLPGRDPSSAEEEERQDQGKRTFSGSAAGGTRYKYAPQLQQKGKLYPDKPGGDRRAKFTLSLDVPTNIMNILFNIAKARSLRAKAAANAHLMAQVGRKK
uniref:urocortin-3 n=1 Tax=Jaculus jaculus TaxID=51337 RepID=UPI0003334276|nr:urocortin-3 [Jaculus jaculus]